MFDGLNGVPKEVMIIPTLLLAKETINFSEYPQALQDDLSKVETW